MNLEELIEKDGRVIYTNKGVSMLPWIHEGKDIMIIKRLETDPKKYDSVLFKRPDVYGRGRYVLHRVMRDYHNGTYYIIGDNTRTGEKVNRENIFGILTTIKQPNRIIDVNDEKYLLKVKLWYLFIWPVLYLFRSFKLIIKKIIFWDYLKKYIKK